MRRALNSNPLVQVGAIALLGVVVAFLMLTRLQGDDPPAETTSAATDPAGVAAADAGATPAPPASDAPVAPTDPADPAAPAVPNGAFVAGPGLPAKIVDAQDRGDSVVLLITRVGGIDDAKLRRTSARLRSEPGVAFFHAIARDIADYSRIVQGVDVDRVPALVALSPRDVGSGPPVATVSYGFRGYDSVKQAVRDAAYEGKQLQYHP